MITGIHLITHEVALAWLDLRGFAAVRREVCAGATGAVLDLGAGTGRNVRWLATADNLTLIEPDRALHGLLGRRAARGRVPWATHEATAEQIPFPDATFDTVVTTLVLCSVTDPAQALAEIRRVLRPGGTLRFAEHVRSPDPSVAAHQDRLANVWRRCSGGCHPNRDTLRSIQDAGFTVQFRRGRIAGAPSLARPLIVGAATPLAPT